MFTMHDVQGLVLDHITRCYNTDVSCVTVLVSSLEPMDVLR